MVLGCEALGPLGRLGYKRSVPHSLFSKEFPTLNHFQQVTHLKLLPMLFNPNDNVKKELIARMSTIFDLSNFRRIVFQGSNRNHQVSFDVLLLRRKTIHPLIREEQIS